MAGIYLRDGVWQLQYYFDGKRKVVSLRTHDKKIAQLLKKQKEIDLEKGLVGDLTKKTIVEYLREYIRDTSYRKLKTNTGEYFYIAKFLKIKSIGPLSERDKLFLGSKTISSLNQEDVRCFLNQYDNHAPKTYNGVFVLLHRFFRLALRNNYIQKNPCQGITRKKVPERLPRYFTDDEVCRVLKAAEHTPVYPFLLIALFTGMRLGELIHLEWQDWDWENKLVRVINKPHLGHTIKNFQARVVPIADGLREKLLPYVKRSGFCFPTYGGKNAGGKYNPDGPRRQMEKILEVADIPKEKNLRFHVFRKTFASHLVQKNVQIYKVSKWLGHSNVLVTQAHYAHLAPQYDKDIEMLCLQTPASAIFSKPQGDLLIEKN